MPKISVITTLFNYRPYIEDCINSFLRQNFIDSEMIIVDDCSTDNPYDVIKKIINKRIKYIKLDKNMGYSFAKNIGIKNSNSDILVMLDADDMLTKNSLTSRYNKILEGYDFVHGPAYELKENKQISGMERFNKWLTSKKDSTCYKLVHAQTVMLKKEIHKIVGLYDENLRYKSDREMWARIFNRPQFKIGWTTEHVAIYRHHSKQMHKSKQKLKLNDKLQSEVLQLIDKRKHNLDGLELL